MQYEAVAIVNKTFSISTAKEQHQNDHEDSVYYQLMQETITERSISKKKNSALSKEYTIAIMLI